MTPDELDAALIEDLADLVDDPLGYVMWAFPWGEGELVDYTGPDDWQAGFLRELGEEIRARNFDGVNPVAPIQFSTASGHGIGKSAMSAFLGCFVLDTRPHSKGIWTANSAPQLETKTWAEFAKWRKRSITAHWWKVSTSRGSLRCTHVQHPETWRIDALAWREHQPEAFAGLHNANSTPWYLFDEASAIPRAIFEVSDGGLTDGEPMRFLFGNPTKNTGYFYDTFHKLKRRYKTRQIDSRTTRFSNKPYLQQLLEDVNNNEDDDYYRVRVLGQFPKQSALQFISKADVEAAQKREALYSETDPIIVAVDVARYGDDKSVIRTRRGRDARSIKPQTFSKLDTMQLAARVVEHANSLLADAVIIDAAGVGGPVADRIRQIDPALNLIEFNGGMSVADPKYHDWNALAWGELREALRAGLAIDDDPELEEELTARNYDFDKQTRIRLEPKDVMKDEIGRSPDKADSLAMTYAAPVGPRDPAKTRREFAGISRDINTTVDYDPMQFSR